MEKTLVRQKYQVLRRGPALELRIQGTDRGEVLEIALWRRSPNSRDEEDFTRTAAGFCVPRKDVEELIFALRAASRDAIAGGGT